MPNEYPSYYRRYISLVADGDILMILEDQKHEMDKFLDRFGEEAAAYRYSPDKWSIKEVIGHVIDVERIFTYRALRFARNDKTPLPEFDQEEYIKNGNFDSRTLIDLADEFRCVRESTITLFASFNLEIMQRQGTASGQNFAVRSIPYIIAGHELHHRQVIQSKYLG